MLRDSRKNSPHPMCNICGHAHAGIAHVWSGKASGQAVVVGSNPTMEGVADAAAGLGTRVPVAKSVGGKARSVAQPDRALPSNSEGRRHEGSGKAVEDRTTPVIGASKIADSECRVRVSGAHTKHKKAETLKAGRKPKIALPPDLKAQMDRLGLRAVPKTNPVKIAEANAKRAEKKAAHELLLGQLKASVELGKVKDHD